MILYNINNKTITTGDHSTSSHYKWILVVIIRKFVNPDCGYVYPLDSCCGLFLIIVINPYKPLSLTIIVSISSSHHSPRILVREEKETSAGHPDIWRCKARFPVNHPNEHEISRLCLKVGYIIWWSWFSPIFVLLKGHGLKAMILHFTHGIGIPHSLLISPRQGCYTWLGRVGFCNGARRTARGGQWMGWSNSLDFQILNPSEHFFQNCSRHRMT